MYDVKPEVFTALSSIAGVKVSDSYPTDWTVFPQITFYELENSDPLTITGSPLSDVSIQVDIWHNRSTGALAAAVDEKMNALGLRRQFAADVPDAAVKHKTMRFHGVIDARNNHVTQ